MLILDIRGKPDCMKKQLIEKSRGLKMLQRQMTQTHKYSVQWHNENQVALDS